VTKPRKNRGTKTTDQYNYTRGYNTKKKKTFSGGGTKKTGKNKQKKQQKKNPGFGGAFGREEGNFGKKKVKGGKPFPSRTTQPFFVPKNWASWGAQKSGQNRGVPPAFRKNDRPVSVTGIKHRRRPAKTATKKKKKATTSVHPASRSPGHARQTTRAARSAYSHGGQQPDVEPSQ